MLNQFCSLLVNLLLFILFGAIKKKNCREPHNFDKAINGCFVTAVFIHSL